MKKTLQLGLVVLALSIGASTATGGHVASSTASHRIVASPTPTPTPTRSPITPLSHR